MICDWVETAVNTLIRRVEVVKIGKRHLLLMVNGDRKCLAGNGQYSFVAI